MSRDWKWHLFQGYELRLTMTVLNASLMFMSEWILLMVLRVKGLMGGSNLRKDNSLAREL